MISLLFQLHNAGTVVSTKAGPLFVGFCLLSQSPLEPLISLDLVRSIVSEPGSIVTIVCTSFSQPIL